MKRRIISLISLIFIFQAFSCKSDSVSPITEEIKPGRRDYEWSVDTVKSTMLILTDIWGSSPNDVWVVGDYGDIEKRIWHYDGTSWNAQGWGVSAECVFGLGSESVYLGELSIWHRNKSSWKNEFSPVLDGLAEQEVIITDIRGNSANALWAVGIYFKDDETAYSAIYHNDGHGWHQQMSLNKKNVQLYEIHPTGESNKSLIYGRKIFYTQSAHNLDLDTNVICEYDGDKGLKEMAAAPHYNNMDRKCGVYRIQDRLLVEMNGAIYEYYQGQYKEFLSAQALKNGYIMGGRSKNDMFIWQQEGLAHYNGTDTQTIFKLKDDIWLIRKALVFSKEIFFYGYDMKGDYYLVKGKLKD